MSYVRAICGECNRPVLSQDGRAIRHAAPGNRFICDGSGEPVTVAPPPEPVETIWVEPVTVAPPAPPPAAEPERQAPRTPPAPLSVDDNALRLGALQVELKKGRTLREAVAGVNEQARAGSIDLEALAECDCPSLAAAVREYLARQRNGHG